jgi:hypothetical protein
MVVGWMTDSFGKAAATAERVCHARYTATATKLMAAIQAIIETKGLDLEDTWDQSD